MRERGRERERETKIIASDSNVFARRQTEQVLGPLSSRVHRGAGGRAARRGAAHKLWIIRDICQMQHISFILFSLPSFPPSFLPLNPTLSVRSFVRPYREIDPRLLLSSSSRATPLSPRGACFFTHSCYMDGREAGRAGSNTLADLGALLTFSLRCSCRSSHWTARHQLSHRCATVQADCSDGSLPSSTPSTIHNFTLFFKTSPLAPLLCRARPRRLPISVRWSESNFAVTA